MKSLEITISSICGTVTSLGSTSKFSLLQTNFTYFPRYNLAEFENSSISVGLPLGGGISIASNTYGNDPRIAFAFDLKGVADYNIGCKSTRENEKSFGGYLGLGFGFYHINISQSQYSNFNGSIYGPLFRGGFRFGGDNDFWKGQHMTIGFFYKIGIEKDKLTTIGINLLYDL